jgi:phenylpropionate dioxygenase-like ring-hydroxylating dioxygenase large terminal subunit
MTKKEMTLYGLCQEMAEESGKSMAENQFGNYYREQKKHFKEILTALGIDPNSLKKVDDDSFEIPVGQKEVVKTLLSSYTNPSMQQVRKSKFFEMEVKDLEPILKQVDELLEHSLEGESQLVQRSRLYTKTRFVVSEALREVRATAIAQIVKDLEGMKQFFAIGKDRQEGEEQQGETKKENRLSLSEKRDIKLLNDSDKAQLLRFYGQLLQEAAQKWWEIVTLFEELRQEEIFSQSERMIEAEQAGGESAELVLDEPYLVLWEAIQTYRQEKEEFLQSLSFKELSPEELNRVEQLLCEHEEKRK